MLLIDTIAVVVMIYFSWKNDLLPPTTPESGPFRITPPGPPPDSVAAKPAERWRSRGL